jgi:hypothetical protein
MNPSPSCDPAIRDPYFAAAVQAIMERIKADGWLLMPPRSRRPGDRTRIVRFRVGESRRWSEADSVKGFKVWSPSSV